MLLLVYLLFVLIVPAGTPEKTILEFSEDLSDSGGDDRIKSSALDSSAEYATRAGKYPRFIFGVYLSSNARR